MKYEKNVSTYLLSVNEIVSTIIALGENVEEWMTAQKVLRSLPLRFDAKVSTIEQMKDLDSLKMDELHGILTTYEMRTKKEKTSKKEAALKKTKNGESE